MNRAAVERKLALLLFTSYVIDKLSSSVLVSYCPVCISIITCCWLLVLHLPFNPMIVINNIQSSLIEVVRFSVFCLYSINNFAQVMHLKCIW